jgi:hypothetical protein
MIGQVAISNSDCLLKSLTEITEILVEDADLQDTQGGVYS